MLQRIHNFKEITMSELPATQDQTNRDLSVHQAQSLGQEMKLRGIKNVEFENGTYAEHNSTTNTTIVAGNGTVVKDTPLTTTVTTIKPGADTKEATKELYDAGNKQVVTAAAQSTSQPTVSGRLSD